MERSPLFTRIPAAENPGHVLYGPRNSSVVSCSMSSLKALWKSDTSAFSALENGRSLPGFGVYWVNSMKLNHSRTTLIPADPNCIVLNVVAWCDGYSIFNRKADRLLTQRCWAQVNDGFFIATSGANIFSRHPIKLLRDGSSLSYLERAFSRL